MGLVISEIMYHPVEEGGTPGGEENLEFIELYNNRAVFEDLGGFAFTNGVKYTFPPGTIIPAGQYLVLAKDPTALKAAYGITTAHGPWTGKLNNDGERVELSNSNGEIIISLRYNDGPPWPPQCDGTGHSLVLLKQRGDPEQYSSWAPSAFIAGNPGGPDERKTQPTNPSLLKHLVVNELLTNSDAGAGLDWLEIYNAGSVTVDLSNMYISEGRFELLQYKIPDGITLAPGEMWAVAQGTPPWGFPFGLGFAGETVFLTEATTGGSPRPLRVVDAVRFGFVEPDVTLGRYPDGARGFQALSRPTPTARNAFPKIRDVVINEIMYHHGSRDERLEYVELYNRAAQPVSLDEWAFTDGITYDFNDTSQVRTIPAGGYLVVAKDPALLETVYDNLTIGVNLVGPYRGELDDHSERLRLSLPIQDIDPHTGEPNTYYVTADEVTYYDGGRWPSWADGEGASLELRDPQSNNNSPDAWADSDESLKSSWQNISYTIYADNPKYTHDYVTVFGMMLLNRGEVLLDDVALEINGTNRLSNGNFESGLSGWRTLGNHVQSHATTDQILGSACLHLVATGHGDPGANRINRNISGVSGGNVTFRAKARWLRGSPFLLMRTTRDRAPVQPPRPAYAFKLNRPLDLGTPGRQNTAFVENRGPDIQNVRHDPIMPDAYQPIVVTASVTDNDGVGSVTLYYRSEGSSTFSTKTMVDNGSGDDLVGDDGIFTAAIPGTSAGKMRAFYIIASDGDASTRFPTELPPSADVPNRTCLVRVGDRNINSQFSRYRIWLSNDVISAFTRRPNLSNEAKSFTMPISGSAVAPSCEVALAATLRGGMHSESSLIPTRSSARARR